MWTDVDEDGIQDAGEMSLSGVQVQLLDAYNNVIATVSTNADGSYRFFGVAPGQYRIRVLLPPDHTFSPQDQGGDDELDSDVDASGYSALFTITEEDEDLDAGLDLSVAIGGEIPIGG